MKDRKQNVITITSDHWEVHVLYFAYILLFFFLFSFIHLFVFYGINYALLPVNTFSLLLIVFVIKTAWNHSMRIKLIANCEPIYSLKKKIILFMKLLFNYTLRLRKWKNRLFYIYLPFTFLLPLFRSFFYSLF